MIEDRLITTRELAEQFGVCDETVQTWVRQGRIPCFRPSRKVIRFRMNDVERALMQAVSEEEGNE